MNTEKKKESPLLSLVLNIALPTLILMKFSDDESLGPVWGLVVALAFPLGYGIYDFTKQSKVNFISVLGFASILLTGAMGLLELDPHWIAVKEAAVPLIIGLAVIISVWTPFPLVKKLLYNNQILNIEKVDALLIENNHKASFEKRLIKSSYFIALSFLLSSVLNYALAKYFLISAPGTAEFNAELGKMNAFSIPVIAIPSTIIMIGVLLWLIKSIKKFTGLEMEEILNT